MKEKKKLQFHISLRGFVAASIILVLILGLAAISCVMIYFSYKSTDENILFVTENNADVVIKRMLSEDTSDEHFRAFVEEAAFSQEGRIIVVDRNYRILADSAVLSGEEEEKAYIISPEVISVMTGDKSGIRVISGDFAKVIIPARNPSGDIVATIISTSAMARANKVHDDIKHINIVALFIVLVIGVVLALLLSWIVVRELNSVNEQISNVAEGNFDTELSVRGFSEIRYLADNYNKVLGKLDTIDSGRQEFVSNVSHELKTPMTSMKVLAESLVQNEGATAEDYREFMGDIIDEVDRETALINDLLTLVKTDKKNAVLNIEEHNIGELIGIIIRRVSPVAEARNIDIQYSEYKEVIAEVDNVKLLLVISNIITNAIKYNVDNGWVRITLNADGKFFYIKVADSGIGIPDDAKDKVFDRFYRVDKARSRDTGGTGLGLAIARNVIFAHGGNIKLYSEFGNGTTFTIKLPIKQEGYVAEE